MSAAETLRRELADEQELEARTLGLSYQMNDALKAGDAMTIAQLANDKQRVILERGRLDQRRSREIPAICAELGLPADATLRQLVTACGEEARAELEPQIDALRTTAIARVEMNRQNAELAEFEIHLIKNLVRSVAAAHVPAGGSIAPYGETRLVDVEA